MAIRYYPKAGSNPAGSLTTKIKDDNLKTRGKKKSLVGYILTTEDVSEVLQIVNGEICINDDLRPIVNAKELLRDSYIGCKAKKVRITLEEL